MKGNKMKKVSIVTPVYNAAEYIAQTIKSVQAQTYSNWEMLIVDDCSTDNTIQVVENFCREDERIRLIKHEKNQGASKTRNTALANATGEYIAFLDGDDLWAPEKLEKQLAFMEENGYVLTYTAYQMFYSEKNEKGKIIYVPSKMTYEEIYYNTAIACLTVMVNREVAGDFEMPVIDHAEDQCTWQSILKRGYVAYGLNENLASYRISANSLTGNKRKAAQKQWRVYRKYHKFSVIKSAIYFTGYAVRAVIKHM